MAAINRPKKADYCVHEAYSVDTKDHEDHTFCGIMFSMMVKAEIPLDYLEIESLSVRGQLGPMSVWTTPGHFDELVEIGEGGSRSRERKFHNERHWACIHKRVHFPSTRQLTLLVFDAPVRVRAGDEISFYVHSELANDRYKCLMLLVQSFCRNQIMLSVL